MTRRVSTPAYIAALVLGAGAIAGPAQALDTIIGGMAAACAKDARNGIATKEAVDNCTDALMAETMTMRDRAATMVNRGTMYLVRKDWDAAVLDFDLAIRMQPKMGEAYVNRGAALVGKEKFAEGEAQITYGLTFSPEKPERAYYNRALARWRLDNLKGAYLDFRTALELKPGWEEPSQQLAYFTVTPVSRR